MELITKVIRLSTNWLIIEFDLMKNLNNKIALLTGASSGIGAAISQKIARRGYYVVMASRNIEKLNSLKELT